MKQVVEDVIQDLREQAFAVRFMKTTLLGVFSGVEIPKEIDGIVGGLVALTYGLKGVANRLEDEMAREV